MYQPFEPDLEAYIEHRLWDMFDHDVVAWKLTTRPDLYPSQVFDELYRMLPYTKSKG